MNPLIIKLGGVLLDSEEALSVCLPRWTATGSSISARW